jgi:RNA polymerase subunit RPABC4/transcription elongation factor Spt4
MLICDKCNAQIAEGAKFCPQCADPVTEADKATKPILQVEPANVEIAFGYSSSPNYVKAVTLCKNIPSYSEKGEGKGATHLISLPITEIELIINIFELVGSWKSSQMLIDGKRSTKSNLVYHGIGCYRQRQQSLDPKQYCFGSGEWNYNIWGCFRLGMPFLAGTWLTHGMFDGNGAWSLDKNKILKDLQSKIHENSLCPILNREFIVNTLNSLPDYINPKEDDNWEYQTRHEEIEEDYREIAIGVTPVLKKMNTYVLGDFKPKVELNYEKYLDSNSNDDYSINIPIEHKARRESGINTINIVFGSATFLFIVYLLYSC